MKKNFGRFVRSSVMVALSAFGMVAGIADVSYGQTKKAAAKVVPNDDEHCYRIGVTTSHANSLHILEVNYGSPADRLGMEAGDIILEVNGRRVNTVYSLQSALRDAAYHNNGRIRVKIDNVRARSGEYGAQRFIVRDTYLNGFAENAFFGGQPVPANKKIQK